MANQPDQKNLDRDELRKFGWLFAAIVVMLFALLLPWLKNRALALWPFYIAVPIALLAAIQPLALRPLYRGWMKFGAVVGFINTRIIMSVVFFVLLTPLAWAMRAAGRDSLSRRFDDNARSYRVVSTVQDKSQMEKPY